MAQIQTDLLHQPKAARAGFAALTNPTALYYNKINVGRSSKPAENFQHSLIFHLLPPPHLTAALPGKRSAMYSVIKSFGLSGLNGFAVEVEADVAGGMPALSIVGLPDSAVRESGDRVHAAIKNLGFKWPDRRITVNLAPADVRKTSTSSIR